MRTFAELGHVLEYHLATARWIANYPIYTMRSNEALQVD